MMLECSRIFVAIKIAPLQTDLYQLLGYIYIYIYIGHEDQCKAKVLPL